MNTKNWQQLNEIVKKKKEAAIFNLNEAYYTDNLIRVVDEIIRIGEFYQKHRSSIERLANSMKSCDFILGEPVNHPNLDKYKESVADPLDKDKNSVFEMLDMINYMCNSYKMDRQKATGILSVMSKETKNKLKTHYSNK